MPQCSSGQSPVPENDLFELVCANGQILMQCHSNTPKRTAACKIPSQCLPSYSPRARDRLTGNSCITRTGKFGELDSVADEAPMSVPSSEMGLNEDEDMVPWFYYAIDNSLQHEYGSDLLAELSGVTAYELPNRDNSSVVDKRSSNIHAHQNSHKNSVYGGASSEQGNLSKVSSSGEGGAAMLDASSVRLYHTSSPQRQTSITSLPSREIEIQNNKGKGTSRLFSDDAAAVPSTGGFSDFKILKQDSVLSSSSTIMMNFSHFARPAALVRANLQSIGPVCASTRTDGVPSEEREFTPSSGNAPKSTPTDSSNGYAKESAQQVKRGMLPSKVDLTPLHSKSHQEHTAVAIPSDEPLYKADTPKDEENLTQIPVEDTAKALMDDEKSMEPAVASSVCSGNSVEKASEPIQNKRRKTLDTEESECHSEDVEEESEGVKKAVIARGGAGSKRSRAAEVHNLSERRRRDRINEKMRALQELIPNCNKVDKASMLDEAIEYLKTLQLQVQMMSMGAGLYMPHMMLPTAVQHMHAPLMPSFSPMGVGMHMGFGMGYAMCMPDVNGTSSHPMMQMPTMQGTHFPAPPPSGHVNSNGMAGSTSQVFGLPGHGVPISMSYAPFISGASVMKSTGSNACVSGGLMGTLDSASMSGTKDQTINGKTQVTHSTAANDAINQMSDQSWYNVDKSLSKAVQNMKC